jgi:hypothetical protein
LCSLDRSLTNIRLQSISLYHEPRSSLMTYRPGRTPRIAPQSHSRKPTRHPPNTSHRRRGRRRSTPIPPTRISLLRVTLISRRRVVCFLSIYRGSRLLLLLLLLLILLLLILLLRHFLSESARLSHHPRHRRRWRRRCRREQGQDVHITRLAHPYAISTRSARRRGRSEIEIEQAGRRCGFRTSLRLCRDGRGRVRVGSRGSRSGGSSWRCRSATRNSRWRGCPARWLSLSRSRGRGWGGTSEIAEIS